jgi:hypothetical protein
MSSARSALCVLLILAAAALGAADAPAAYVHRDKCNLDGPRTVALTKQVRVFADHDVYYACLRATGKKTELFASDGIYTDGVVRRAAGRHVAYEVSEIPACKADCPPDVHATAITSVIDAKTGRVRDLHNGPIATLILRPSGSVAWLTGSPPDAELNLWTATRRTLDSGDISDVHVEGVRLVWTKAGTRLSTSFD